MSTAIVWFRRDLRLTDNSALQAALAGANSVLPVYIHDPAADREWAPGDAGRWWLHHSLSALDAALRASGSRLVMRSGDTANQVRTLIAETGATQLHWNRLYEPRAAQRDSGIKTLLREMGIAADSHAGCLLHEPMQLQTGTGQPFRVFTPFWKAFQRVITPTEPVAAPRRLPAPQRWPDSVSLQSLRLLPVRDWADGFSDWWMPGEAGALQQLRSFLKRAIGHYQSGRDYPSRTDVSYLSPHLHFGELSPRQIWHAVHGFAAGHAALEAGAQTYLRELGWREFAHHVLFNFPHTPDEPMYERFRGFPWRKDYSELLPAWQRGRTGYPIVDAGMRELWTTGWMHNRVRMIVASFLVKNLRIPWQEGARWFWDTLVDADLANNTMGWQWSAGCGADAAPYFRVFNPVLQSKKFDPDGEYLRRWLPELAKLNSHLLHEPWRMSIAEQQAAGCVLGRDYPLPVVDYKDSREAALMAYSSIKANLH